MEKRILDNELGVILLRTHPRATRYTLKIVKGQITAVMPVGGSESRMLAFINERRDVLLSAIKRQPKMALLNEETSLQTCSFSLRIFRTDRNDYYVTLKDHVLHIACPASISFDSQTVQRQLNQILQKALRHEAHRLLPERLQQLACKHGFLYKSLKINSSKGRWGSCSSKQNINLSLSLMLLPWHLIDYVLLHELCHTKEMNHGENFWALMDQVTEGKARVLRAELRKYTTLVG